MIDNPDIGASAVGYVLGGAGLLSMAWQYWTNRRVSSAQAAALESDATGKVGLIDALEARIQASESRQNAQDLRIADLEGRIAKEIDLRLSMAEENHKLRLRVTELEFEIRQLRAAALGGDS